MPDKAKSRWADTEEDAELTARRRSEREEKRRYKAEKARQVEMQQSTRRKQQQHHHHQQLQPLPVLTDRLSGVSENRPAKRRKVTPEPSAATTEQHEGTKLLRFEAGSWGKCRSVENFDKLNDIEEGTYGWVARATEVATGRIVALKRLKIEAGDRNGLPVTGLREVQILRDCKHRNIVCLEEIVVGEDLSKLDR